ncbi:GGDEF domain-containing protein [Pseudooceanicola sp.]|uniref:GGDEF domain-containing protein n=1 Tax=Pseudooceanicola sp. TaxID=1914328 RepID=UPI00261541EF|nr:GGDEF domain-containing protein [Pseudooceanicola sp.]
MLDLLCPMHALLDASGRMIHVGPTLQKLRPDAPLVGRRFLELVELLRPRDLHDVADLWQAAGIKLRLRLRDQPRTSLSGVLWPQPGGGAVVNLSFGISIVEAVRDYPLSNADFAPTDLAVEMLFLVEAKSAAMEALRQMSLRFHGARIVAEEQAMTDPATGLRNRRALDYILGQLIEGEQDFSLMHVDLDHFKQVNDRHGHAAGDAVLKQVARAMIAETREVDTVARVGGDEFVLLFHRLCDRDRLSDIARRLIARIEQPVAHDDILCRVSASVGITLSTAYHPPRAEQMLADADSALYAAKRGGRAQHRFHRPAGNGAGAVAVVHDLGPDGSRPG